MGPLKGVNILEVGGIGPVPFCGQLLSDMGATIMRIDRKGESGRMVAPPFDVNHRGRRSVGMNLKHPEGLNALLKLIEKADILIEGFRPGVMERLGLGPEDCFTRNPKIVYGRMTGWGQEGPLSQAAGHDINYIALSGALHAVGNEKGKPVQPLNLVGDLGGGAMYLAFGVVCALLEARQSGQGQVVDATMIDGITSLMGSFFGRYAAGMWTDQRGTNLLDGGAHFYNTYETADGKWISLGSIEPQFYALLLQHTGLEDPNGTHQMDTEKWPEFKEKLKAVFKSKTRDQWCKIMEGTDTCFAPVLSFDEVMEHPHNKARKVFVDVNGMMQPGPAPRFSRTKPEVQGPAVDPGAHTEPALIEWGFSEDEISRLKTAGAV